MFLQRPVDGFTCRFLPSCAMIHRDQVCNHQINHSNQWQRVAQAKTRQRGRPEAICPGRSAGALGALRKGFLPLFYIFDVEHHPRIGRHRTVYKTLNITYTVLRISAIGLGLQSRTV